MSETLCGIEFATQIGVNIHEATCRECRSQKKSHRKNNERFHRMCLATKGRAKVNRAMHHGRKPKSSVRLDSEHQR